MDDKQKSKKYFDGHSRTFVNRNGYWNYDYRLTSRILKKRNVKKLIDIGCGNGAFLEIYGDDEMVLTLAVADMI